MKLVVITMPDFFADEAQCIEALFRNGLQYLHLRKPKASAEEYGALLRQIDSCYYDRIVLHDHFELLEEFPLKGVHLNSRNPQPPVGWCGHVSRSCHSLEEVETYKPHCDYLFLSPIYDSISKEGYGATFTPEALIQAKRAGIIDEKVVALGGVKAEYLPDVNAYGFGGAAFLGYVWHPFVREGMGKGIESFRTILEKTHYICGIKTK